MDRQPVTTLVVRADSRRLPLPDSSVDLVVTSPPYFGLRSYQDGGKHYEGQVGDEATPAEFVAALLEVTAECMRVLKPSGSIWVNLGDKYAGKGGGAQGATSQRVGRSNVREQIKHNVTGVRDKSLIGLPWRYALACIDDLGLILRAEVIWSKPNGLPESVTDRVRRSHEQWFHFTKEPRYFSAVDEIREPHVTPLHKPGNKAGAAKAVGPMDRGGHSQWEEAAQSRTWGSELGKLPGSVWTIPTQPLQVPAHLGVDHFAAFPMEFPRRIIKGWSPSGICVECGEGRRPTVDKNLEPVNVTTHAKTRAGKALHPGVRTGSDGLVARQSVTITGEACACPTPDAPTRPAVVLDPFSGTGTTALVASSLGRLGIGVDLSHDYSRLAKWRTTDPGQRAAAMQVEKPPVELAGQADLFGDVA